MRATFCLCALLGALASVLPAGPAQARIRPLPKPAGAAVQGARASIAPVRRTVAQPAGRPPRTPPPARSARPLHHTRALRARRYAPIVARSRGGRREPLASSGGGHLTALRVAPAAIPEPTPLGLVGVGDVLPASGAMWPDWTLSLVGVLVAGEAMLLVRLVRARRLDARI
jgi:hypothetical protein